MAEAATVAAAAGGAAGQATQAVQQQPLLLLPQAPSRAVPQDHVRRMEDTMVSCPIVYGSVAFFLGRKADAHATHNWKLFVRSPTGHDLSVFIDKVAFYLHHSFQDPIRVVDSPPFEISEAGWGEFESSMRIFFKDPHEEPLDILHFLKLYPPEGVTPNPKEPVLHEFYDEVVFTNPTPAFYSQLMQLRDRRLDANQRGAWEVEHGQEYSDAEDVSKLQSALQIVSTELEETRRKTLAMKAQLTDMQQRHAGMQAEKQAQAAANAAASAAAAAASNASTHLGQPPPPPQQHRHHQQQQQQT